MHLVKKLLNDIYISRYIVNCPKLCAIFTRNKYIAKYIVNFPKKRVYFLIKYIRQLTIYTTGLASCPGQISALKSIVTDDKIIKKYICIMSKYIRTKVQKNLKKMEVE